MRSLPALALGLILAACGRPTPTPAPQTAAPPWVPTAGLWLQSFVSGEQAGFQTVTCFAPGHGDVFGDERPPETDGQMTCEAVQRSVTQGGWTADQRCALRGSAGLYQYVAQGNGTEGALVTVNIIDPQTRQPLSTPAQVRFRRVGACRAALAPGEVLQINQPGPNGRFSVMTPGANGAPGTIRELAALPPEIAALRLPRGSPLPPTTPR